MLERTTASPRSNGARLPFVIKGSRDLPCETSNAQALTHVLTQLRSALRITQPVVLGVPSGWTILTTVHPLIVKAVRAGLAVQFELQQALPFDVAAVAWDYQSLTPPPRAVTASRLQPAGAVVVGAMRRTLLQDRLTCCERAGLTIRAVALNPLATLNAWQVWRGTVAKHPLCILQIVNAQTAEWIVRTATNIQVIPVSHPSSHALHEELLTSWRSLISQLGQPPASVGVVGAVELIDELQQAVLSRLEVPVERLAPEISAHPATAIGLALHACGAAPLTLNLLAGVQQHEQVQRARQAATVVSGLSALTMLGFGVSSIMELSHRRAVILQALEQREHLYQTLRPEVRALLQQQERLEQQTRQLEHLISRGPLLTKLLAQVAKTLPDTIWLTKFEGAKGATLIEGTLEGRARSFQDVTQFMEHLKTQAGMSTVKPLSTTVTTDEATGKDVIAFAVQLQQPLAATTP